MSPTRATANTWSPKTGVPGPLDRWRRQSTPFLPNAWRRLDRRTEKGLLPWGEALVWPQRRPYKKTTAGVFGIDQNTLPANVLWCLSGTANRSAEENAGCCGARVETDIR